MKGIYEVLISIAVIILVAWVGERWRGLAGILATMPLTIPLAMIIIYRTSSKDLLKTTELVQGMLSGIVATGCFVLAAWLALRRRWPFPMVILSGYAAWGLALLLWRLAERLLQRGGAG
ncbi:MAG: DUF3147 family protein [Chloroflexia bacterium]|nr:DUF3147 family protein [Chloroflexia bacterium]